MLKPATSIPEKLSLNLNSPVVSLNQAMSLPVKSKIVSALVDCAAFDADELGGAVRIAALKSNEDGERLFFSIIPSLLHDEKISDKTTENKQLTAFMMILF